MKLTELGSDNTKSGETKRSWHKLEYEQALRTNHFLSPQSAREEPVRRLTHKGTPVPTI